jgi:hypothetical protein
LSGEYPAGEGRREKESQISLKWLLGIYRDLGGISLYFSQTLREFIVFIWEEQLLIEF